MQGLNSDSFLLWIVILLQVLLIVLKITGGISWYWEVVFIPCYVILIVVGLLYWAWKNIG